MIANHKPFSLLQDEPSESKRL